MRLRLRGATIIRAVGRRLVMLAPLVLIGSVVRSATGQTPAHAAHGLGTVSFPISCSPAAAAEFTRGVALLHHMTYPRAREAFEQTARLDSTCAMAQWGIAMTLFQPLWPTRPGPAELRQGWDAVQRARSLQPPTDRERLFVDAAAAFFEDPASPAYWQRIRRWEQAMQKAYAAFPRDPEVAALYALAHLAVTPPNVVSVANADKAAAILLDVYKQNPDHPGAMHYLVHADDVPGREREQLDVVQKYDRLAPDNPHALHMPTHIYVRLGDWDAVIDGNLRAADAALAQPAGDRGQFVWDEFPHAVEYVVYAYLQRGADEKAAAQATRLRTTARLQPSFKTAFHLASTEARYALERHAWTEAAALIPRDSPTIEWDRFPWAEGITWFARGLGAARTGKLREARTAADRLGVLEDRAATSGEELFARNIRILRLEVRAWIAHAEQHADSSVSLMRQAAELELATPKHAVTPGPTLPAFELLGDLLLDQKRPVEALAAYERALSLYPHRFNALIGAARAAHASGDHARARAHYQQLITVATGSTRSSVIAEARARLRR
ncbi:MAG: repeat protein [Geminicoccaceae bacterium]|nr:repeat protein [Geminicoccaceae bacterium]